MTTISKRSFSTFVAAAFVSSLAPTAVLGAGAEARDAASKSSNARKKVLTIGLDPRRQPPPDASAVQGPVLSQAEILSGVERATRRLQSLGFDITNCMIAGDTAEREARTALQEGAYDVVVIGAGLRLRSDMLVLFEKIINAVHELAPTARIALHTTPEDFADAVVRVSGP